MVRHLGILAPTVFMCVALGAIAAACSETNVSPDEDPVVIPTEDTDDWIDPNDLPIPTATAPLYAQTSGELFEIDPATGDITKLGDFLTEDGTEVFGMVDIAIDLEGRLFGGTFDDLYQIDPETGKVVQTCSWVGDPPFALAFTSEGELVAGAGSEIRLIDIDTCQARTLVNSRDYETSGDLVGLPDGYLYWSVRGGQGQPDELVRVDPRDGAQLSIGIIGFEKLFGMAYYDDRLYGFADDGSMVRIEPDTANSFLLGKVNDKRWYGATTNPVLWD